MILAIVIVGIIGLIIYREILYEKSLSASHKFSEEAIESIEKLAAKTAELNELSKEVEKVTTKIDKLIEHSHK